jgi:hypothetical protein
MSTFIQRAGSPFWPTTGLYEARMLIYYRDGEKLVPRSIWLACLGWEAVRPKGESLPRQILTAWEYAAMHA